MSIAVCPRNQVTVTRPVSARSASCISPTVASASDGSINSGTTAPIWSGVRAVAVPAVEAATRATNAATSMSTLARIRQPG